MSNNPKPYKLFDYFNIGKVYLSGIIYQHTKHLKTLKSFKSVIFNKKLSY